MEMYILSGIYVWAKIVEMMADRLWHFSANLDLTCCPHLLLNDLQDCNETQWSVRLPLRCLHIVRNLCFK